MVFGDLLVMQRNDNSARNYILINIDTIKLTKSNLGYSRLLDYEEEEKE